MSPTSGWQKFPSNIKAKLHDLFDDEDDPETLAVEYLVKEYGVPKGQARYVAGLAFQHKKHGH